MAETKTADAKAGDDNAGKPNILPNGWPLEHEQRFAIRTVNPLFTGERFGLAFVEGLGWTDDPKKAHSCMEYGFRYYDYEKKKEMPPAKDAKADDTDDDGVAKK